MPRASIVIPCYNAERFIEATVESARRQTVGDVEIICVDDGSTDATPHLLEQLAAEDPRIRVIVQENGGEGPARDAGLAVATGEWLYFLDADDLMLPNLLEEAIAFGEREQADMVVFRTLMLDDQTGEQNLCEWSFRHDWLDEGTNVFCPRDYPEHIFNSFQNWVHNKVFRGTFVREHDLHMQHVHRTADLLFTCRALAEAERIALLDAPLHLYRVNNAQSAMATADMYPLDFYTAFLALRDSLERQATWELYHDSFVNWAIDGTAYNLRTARTFDAYQTIADTMQAEGFERLDIVGFPREKSDMLVRYDQIQPLVKGSPEESLFRLASSCAADWTCAETSASHARVRCAQLKDELQRKEHEIDEQAEVIEKLRETIEERDERIAAAEEKYVELRHAFDCVTSSKSFKLGRAITFLPRTAVRLARRKK